MRRKFAIAFLASALMLCTAMYAVGESLVKGIYSEEITKKDFQLIVPEEKTMAAAGRMMAGGTTAGITDLPIWGMSFHLAVDDVTGDVWLSYQEGGVYSQSPLSIFNCETMERIQVPDAVVFRGFFRSGIAARGGTVHVAWSSDNMHLLYKSYNVSTRQWSNTEQIYQDEHYPNTSLSDTNFNSLAVANDGTIMCVFAADIALRSKYKRPGQGWSGVQMVAPPSMSEPRCPFVQPHGNEFITCYTMITGDKGIVGVSRWNGEWTKCGSQVCPEFQFNNINQSFPDSAACFVDQAGNVYTSWLNWEKSTNRYSKAGYGQKKGGAQSETAWGIVYQGGELDHPTTTPVAVDSEGNIVAGYFNFISSDKRTFIKTKEVGQDWVTQFKGDDAQIALTYNRHDKHFYLVYISGAVKLEKFTFEESSGPTPTPTPSLPPGEIGQWDVLKLALYTSKNYNNPFKDEKLFGWFAEPGVAMPGTCTGSPGCHAVEGVYDGMENGKHKFILNFRPDKKGTWTYTTFSQTGNKDLRIANTSLKVVDPRPNNHGPMKREGKFIVHADGTGHQHLGGTAFGLLWKGPYKQFLQRYIDKGVTYFRIGFWITWGRGCNGQDNGYGGCCDEAKINGCWLGIWPYEFWAYPRNPNPDWTRMNVAQFQKLEETLDYLLERGCYAEILLYDSTINGSMQEYGEPHGYLAGDQRQKNYLDYISKRFAAYPNFWYELGNEVRHSTGPDKMKPSHDWVFWVFNTIKANDPNRLLAYEAPGAAVNYQDPGWSWNPNFHYVWSHTIPQGSHKEILESNLCDIINIHSSRGGEWWAASEQQMLYLSQEFGKPCNNDEPHRKGYYGLPCEDWQIRRATWRTAMVGNAYYTIHGVSLGDFCRACIEDGDLGANMSKHFTKFWNKLSVYGFNRDNSLYEGNGSAKRAMNRNDVYVYYVEDGSGWVKLKTHKKQKYSMYVMDTITGEVIAEQVKDSQDPTVDVGGKRDFAAFLKPYVPPTPTPTPTPSVTPTPTPGNGHGGIGCLCAHLSYADDGSTWTAADEAADIAPTVLLVVLLIGVVGYLRRFL